MSVSLVKRVMSMDEIGISGLAIFAACEVEPDWFILFPDGTARQVEWIEDTNTRNEWGHALTIFHCYGKAKKSWPLDRVMVA